jgi:hypothetical protein
MVRRGSIRARFAMAAVVVTGGMATAVAAPDDPDAADPAELEAPALALPGPNQFVTGLDLECFETLGPTLNLQLQLRHLNPVLIQLGLPAHAVVLRELVQTCVPVAKNGVSPQPAALPFIQQTDLACYRIDAAPLPAPVTLSLKHLNPVLAGLPAHKDVLIQPVQLCVPVAKNGVTPTPDILQLIQFIDLECYAVNPEPHPTFGVNLKQLNPQLGNIPNHGMALASSPRQLCVPVLKNNQAIPAAVLNIVRWIDLEKFAASPLVAVPPVTVILSHLNPLLLTLPRVQVTLQRAVALMVPVSKNGAVPPPP